MEVSFSFLHQLGIFAHKSETSPQAGKSTLLQILAGKRLLTKSGTDVRIKERDVFRQYPSGVTFLGTEWSVPSSSYPRVQIKAPGFGSNKG